MAGVQRWALVYGGHCVWTNKRWEWETESKHISHQDKRLKPEETVDSLDLSRRLMKTPHAEACVGIIELWIFFCSCAFFSFALLLFISPKFFSSNLPFATGFTSQY